MPEPSVGESSPMWNPDVRVLESRRMNLATLDWQLDLCSPFWRIYVNDRSGAYVEYAGKRVELTANTVWVVPAWVRFQTGYRNLVMQDYLHFTFGGFPAALLRRFDRPVRLKQSSVVQALIGEWRRGITENESFSHLCLAGAAAHACLAVLLSDRTMDQEDYRRWFSETSEILPALERLESDLAHPAGNGVLGRLCGMSEDHFIRRFRTLMGVTPAEHGRRIRIAKAAEWLTSTRRTIDDVAEASGFVDRSHFSRTFREQLGNSPAEYRRMHRLEAA